MGIPFGTNYRAVITFECGITSRCRALIMNRRIHLVSMHGEFNFFFAACMHYISILQTVFVKLLYLQ